jgi:proline racemase
MTFQDHLRTYSYCRKDSQKVTVSIKSAPSYYREKKLAELGAVIKGISYPGISYVGVNKSNANTTKTRSASNAYVERQFKLKELGRIVRGL